MELKNLLMAILAICAIIACTIFCMKSCDNDAGVASQVASQTEEKNPEPISVSMQGEKKTENKATPDCVGVVCEGIVAECCLNSHCIEKKLGNVCQDGKCRTSTAKKKKNSSQKPKEQVAPVVVLEKTPPQKVEYVNILKNPDGSWWEETTTVIAK